MHGLSAAAPKPLMHCVTAALSRRETSLGFEKLTLKKETLRGYIPTEGNDRYFQGELFGHILKWVQAHSRQSRLKELKGKLNVIVENVKTLEEARGVLEGLKVG